MQGALRPHPPHHCAHSFQHYHTIATMPWHNNVNKYRIPWLLQVQSVALFTVTHNDKHHSTVILQFFCQKSISNTTLSSCPRARIPHHNHQMKSKCNTNNNFVVECSEYQLRFHAVLQEQKRIEVQLHLK